MSLSLMGSRSACRQIIRHYSKRGMSEVHVRDHAGGLGGRGFGRGGVPTDSEVCRTVICADAIDWLKKYDGKLPGSVYTSLPDISELPDMFPGTYLETVKAYKEWFTDTVSLICSKVKPTECVIFLQSDVRVVDVRPALVENRGMVEEWIDKSSLCAEGVRRFSCSPNGYPMQHMWHKICLVRALSTKSMGRPGFSHLVCFSGASQKYRATDFVPPDVFERGVMVWPKGIGLNAGLIGVNFIHNMIKSSTLIDPFCGHGTVLALAEGVGMKNTIGVEISNKRCRKASVLDCRDRLKSFSDVHLRLYGCTDEQIQQIRAYEPSIPDGQGSYQSGETLKSYGSTGYGGSAMDGVHTCTSSEDCHDSTVDSSMILTGTATLPKTEEEEEAEDQKACSLLAQDDCDDDINEKDVL